MACSNSGAGSYALGGHHVCDDDRAVKAGLRNIGEASAVAAYPSESARPPLIDDGGGCLAGGVQDGDHFRVSAARAVSFHSHSKVGRVSVGSSRVGSVFDRRARRNRCLITGHAGLRTRTDSPEKNRADS